VDIAFDDVDDDGVDAIVLSGDIATGPMPAETLDRLPSYANRPSGAVVPTYCQPLMSQR
jgi:hypothetical protein